MTASSVPDPSSKHRQDAFDLLPFEIRTRLTTSPCDFPSDRIWEHWRRNGTPATLTMIRLSEEHEMTSKMPGELAARGRG